MSLSSIGPAFIVPAAVIFIGALIAVTRSNVLHAVFGLAVSLVGFAGAFLVLGSPFVAVMEVLIYVGGISVTMIFAVMLSTVDRPIATESWLRRGLAFLSAAVFFVGVASVILSSDFGTGQGAPAADWSLTRVGGDLLGRFNVAFETLSVVLLLAIVGAIVIARREPKDPDLANHPTDSKGAEV